MRKAPAFRRSRRAFSLIEVVLALGVCVFALVTMMGLLSVGLGVGKDSREQMQAANIATRLVTVRRNAPTNAVPGLLLPPLNQTLPTQPVVAWIDSEGNAAADAAHAAYQVNYLAGTNASPANMALVHLRFTWPAAADPNKVIGRYELTTQVSLP